MKPTKRAPGRPKKAPEEKLEQFSIRLPPKLKFGLDLLAKVQGRSLSQAIEWALQVGLRNQPLKASTRHPDADSLGEVVDALWDVKIPERRLVHLWQVAPQLVSFEDRALCELVATGKEANWRTSHEVEHLRNLSRSSFYLLADRITEIYWTFVVANWATLREIAHDLAMTGKSTYDLSINELLRRCGKRELADELVEDISAQVEEFEASVAAQNGGATAKARKRGRAR